MPFCYKCKHPVIYLAYNPGVTRLSFRDLQSYAPPKELPIDRDPSVYGTMIVYTAEIPWYENGKFSRRNMNLYRKLSGCDLADARRNSNVALYTCHYDTCPETPENKRRRAMNKPREIIPANHQKKKISETDLAVKRIYSDRPIQGVWCYSYSKNEGHTPDGKRCAFAVALLNATWDVYIEYEKQSGILIERPPNLTGTLILEMMKPPPKPRKKKVKTR